MSKQYDLYLQDHRANVAKGWEWIKENLPQVADLCPIGIEHQICYEHDISKDEPDEYHAYDAYFYGGNRSYQVVQDFNYAWLKHIHRNPHHWQYWILTNDDPELGEIILDMPYEYIVEMICDWWAFSWKSGNLTEIFNWYEQHRDYMKLSPTTRLCVEEILEMIKAKLVVEIVKEEVNA